MCAGSCRTSRQQDKGGRTTGGGAAGQGPAGGNRQGLDQQHDLCNTYRRLQTL